MKLTNYDDFTLKDPLTGKVTQMNKEHLKSYISRLRSEIRAKDRMLKRIFALTVTAFISSAISLMVSLES